MRLLRIAKSGGTRARSKGEDLRSSGEGLRGFKSHPPHLLRKNVWEFVQHGYDACLHVSLFFYMCSWVLIDGAPRMAYSLDGITTKMEKLRTFLINNDFQVTDNNIKEVLAKFLEFKKIVGNIDMDIHFLASYLANSFLEKKHSVTIDLDRAVGSSGLDIESKGIVAEIKTTIPYLENDFGAKQKESIRDDLERLEQAAGRLKYFFVIDGKAETILRQKYSRHYPSVNIINLLNEKRYLLSGKHLE